MRTAVDLVVNTYERTYRKVLRPGWFTDIESQNRCSFAQKIALINNVHDEVDARARAEALLNRRELDAYYFVADRLAGALGVTGLTPEDLGRVPYYTDFLLVAVTLPGNPYLLHWDAEVRLRAPVNWIDPAVALMERDARIFVSNPNWRQPTLRRETISRVGEFALGYGFSDQLFLVRRSDLARPIYKSYCPASLRYPLAHVVPIFEQRVDAYMRTHGRLRATYTGAVYDHPETEGASHPSLTWAERAKLVRNKWIVRVLRRRLTANPRWSV